jgi:predicted membrane-bound spermidine synthase
MHKANFYIGVFLVSFAALMLQIVQTRILSVVVWYHLAFFVISLAMFGLTAGAVWVYLKGERFAAKTLSYDLAYFSGLFAFATAIGLGIQMTLAPVITRIATTFWLWTELALCLSLPFFFAGVVISLALTRSPYPVARVYGVDLVGAASGAVGALLLLGLTDGPSAVLWVAVFAAASSMAFSASGIGTAPEAKPMFHAWLWRRQWIFLFLLVAAVVNPYLEHGLQPIAVKGKFEFPGTHALRRWNSFSRVDVSHVFRGPPVMWGPSPRMFEKRWVVDQVDLFIDGDAGTTAYRFDGNFANVEFLKYDVTNLGYFLPGRERGVVVGVGGGRDVLSAALFGLKQITAVELNPILVDLQTRSDGLLPFTNLAAIPGIRFVADEGRSWLARSSELFDVIQMSLVDTWAATGAGAFTLSENGLYTVDAWKIFMSRLTPKGTLTVSRWYDPGNPDETGRLVSLAAATLMEMGVREPRRHLLLAAQKQIATLVLAKSPLAPGDVEALEKAAAFYQHEILITPSREPASRVLERIVNAPDRRSLETFTGSLEFDLTPPTDERPFFFNQLPLSRPLQALAFARGVLATTSEGGGVRRGNLVATVTLLLLFTIALALVVAVLIIPLRGAIAEAGSRLVTHGTLYFALIGMGFMLIEIGLLQRMSIFLGHPVYSLSVLLSTLILSTGLGSFLSEKLPLHSNARLVSWGVITGIYAFSLPFCLGPLFASFSAAELGTRIAICVAFIAPAGILLGFGFPTGMRLVSAIDPKPAPWFWGINGAAGVLASILAVTLSLALGISATLVLGALCYFLLVPISLTLLRAEKITATKPTEKPQNVIRKAKSPARSR